MDFLIKVMLITGSSCVLNLAECSQQVYQCRSSTEVGEGQLRGKSVSTTS